MTKLKLKTCPIVHPLATVSWSPASLLVITSTLATLFVASEWVFIFTRPSFLQTVSFLEKTTAFLSMAGLLILFCFLTLSLLLLPGWFIKKAGFRKALMAIGYTIPAFLLTSLCILLLDNFTYTLFRFGIVSTSGVTRALYTALFVTGFIYLYFKLLSFHELLASFFTRVKPSSRKRAMIVVFVIAIAGALLPADITHTSSQIAAQPGRKINNATPPDILLITVDGVNAEYTSLENSEIGTTPFLLEISSESMNARNTFSNAQGTIGSLTAILTGRHPVDTRVIYSSDMLQAGDAYKHLPGILRNYGYYTAQLSNPQYADAYKANFQGAFTEANGRSIEQNAIMFALSNVYPGVEHIFHQEVIERLSARLGHIFFINDMANPYDQVVSAAVKFDDQSKLDRVFELLEHSSQPVFIHLHWMGTHGPIYHPDEQVFSQGLDFDQQDENKQLFYFDSLLEFDRAVEKIYTYLDDHGQLENTILLVTSDHTKGWTNGRVPLLIRFPKQQPGSVITTNVQTIDIAPTLLSYLGIKAPNWMAGRSLLATPLEDEPIFAAKIPKSNKDPLTNKIVYPESEAPFYQFGRISVIECSQWFELDLQAKTLTSGLVRDHQAPCAEESDETQALALIINHLERYGFDTSSLNQLEIKLRNQ